MSYYLKAGEKIRLKDIGVFKVGFSSIGVNAENEERDVTCHTSFCLFQIKCLPLHFAGSHGE